MYLVAVKMLVGDTSKFIGILIGIIFASLIMTQQPSIFVGLMARTYSLLSDIKYPDLWVMDPTVRYVDDIKPMQDTKLFRIMGMTGVDWAVPLYKGSLTAKMNDGTFRTCTIIGLDDATLIGAPPEIIKGRLTDLRQNNAVIVNAEGANRYLRISTSNGETRPLTVGDTLEVNDHRAVIVGVAATTSSFNSNPLLYTTYTRALEFAPSQRLRMSFILAGVKDKTKIKEVQERIKEHTGLAAYTNDEFRWLTLRYYIKNTGIPINFGMSVGLGFLVGAAIAGLMFFNFTQDNLKQFGALKAMGTSNFMLVKMILFQGLIVGLTGWGIGIGLASLFGYRETGGVLAFKMTWEVLWLSIIGVTVIVLLASYVSIRKVIKLEPAIVFKG